MNRKLVWTLVVIALTVLVLLLNVRRDATIDLYFARVTMRAAFAYLSFTSIGVLIGVLLK
ncbi:MAG: hypothetical protein BWK77_01815 [Verrucomicrobia bacterium A1]|nr:MAG: hypothetical protein BWK77_01815 [Verrucomicrobia bacterium A1]